MTDKFKPGDRVTIHQWGGDGVEQPTKYEGLTGTVVEAPLTWDSNATDFYTPVLLDEDPADRYLRGLPLPCTDSEVEKEPKQ